MPYTAVISTPGHLPDSAEEAPTFDTAREAWEYLGEQRREHEDDNPDWSDHVCLDPNACGYTDTVQELDAQASADAGPGSITGPTPGYEGDHDLGLAYTVTEVDLYLDVWLRIPEEDNPDDEADAEANTRRSDSGSGYVVDWYLNAVGLVKQSPWFATIDDAHAWLTAEGFADYSS